MMGRTHMAVGAAAGSVVAVTMPDAWLPVVLAAVVGSILPDLDHPHSKAGRRIRPISDLLYWTAGHRGGTHSLAFLVILTALASLVYLPAGLGLGVGIASHLAADAISYGSGRRWTTGGAGVPLLWPFSEAKTGVRIMKVGGILETLVVLPSCLLLSAMIASALS